MEFPQLTLELARRVERAEAQAAIACAETLNRIHPGAGAVVEHIAGGAAVFCGVNSPVTQAIGVGLDGPVDHPEMDRLEHFYFSRGDAVRIELCPLADPSVVAHLGQRGYRVTEFSNLLARPLNAHETWPVPPPAIQIERIAPAQAAEWTELVAQGFAEHFPVTPELLSVVQVFALSLEAECYLARVNGEPAGGATLALRNGIAGLFGASTLPAFRNRGVQTALLHARLARAIPAGCELAVSLAQPASASHRNIARQGFHPLYTRVKFEREAPKKAPGN
jgi:GNAT superfamily N-acetyltransferase